MVGRVLFEVALPETTGEVRRRDDVDAIVGAAWAGFVAGHKPIAITIEICSLSMDFR